jgi:glycosyltransferase involved in cell wall biosynthesis
MKITHVNFARGFRGGERQTLNLVEGLARLGFEQTLVCRTDSELQRRASALGLHALALPHPLLGHLAVPRTDLVHVHEARGAYWAGIEYALRKTPYIITRRIPNPISKSRVTRSVYRHATALFGVSQDVSQRLSNQTGLPVRTVLSSSSALVPDAAKVADIRRQLGAGPIIGHVGALHDHHKGQAVLIQAFQRLVADYPQARLLLVGEGPDRRAFESLAQRDERIVFAGFQQDVGSWLAAMDLFVFPSREEGLGSVVLDAMALGVPVLTSTVGGLPELIGADERGQMVGDHHPRSWEMAIRRLLTDKAARSCRVESASQFAGANDVAAMSKSYAAFYDEIVGRGLGHVNSAQPVGISH